MNGSTGMAIGLIGLGVLGIGLSYTGRGPAVLAAIRGATGGGDVNAPGGGGIDPAPGNPKGQADCPAGTVWNAASSECLTPQSQANSGGPQQYFVNSAGGVGISNGASTGMF